MHTMDRYIAGQFLRVFVMTFLCLLGMYIIGEFVTNFSEFMEYRGVTKNFGWAMASYYAARIPMFFEMAGPIVALLAAVLVISWMQRHNELTALQSAGISCWQVARPLIGTCVLLAVIGIINREIGLPWVRELLVNDIRAIVNSRAQTVTPRYDNHTDILFDGDEILPATRQIKNARLRLPFNWQPIGYEVHAQVATYQEASQQLPAGYLLSGIAQSTQGAPSVMAETQPILLSPHDTAWLQSDQCFVASELQPSLLRGNHRWQQYSSTGQLLAGLQAKSGYPSPTLRVELHSRFVRPLLDMALVLVGLPIALATQRRHVFAGAAKTLLIVALFSGISIACRGLGGQSLMDPALAAWIPLLIFGPAAVLFSGPLTR